MIAHDPLHGSGRAALPHPTLALGEDAHAQGIGMTDGRHRQPASDDAPHAIRQNAPFWLRLHSAMPEPSHLEPKEILRRLIHGHPVVADVNASTLLLRAARHDSGPMWVAISP